ncbi:hypothetical protein LJC32_00400 [Oscillospiraceae bacterium OttesenSCG-928-F05]|nr:hypothetical protein [Oscillospiraceae bacterium OttesenSCG-928-F05]
MGELEDKIQNLLSSPDGLDQVLSLARTLTGGGAEPEDAPPAPAFKPPDPQTAQTETPLTGGGSDLSLFSQIDPKILTAAMRVMGQYTSDDDRISLLYALKPHLRDDRSDRLERAVQIVRLSKTIRSALEAFGGGGNPV